MKARIKPKAVVITCGSEVRFPYVEARFVDNRGRNIVEFDKIDSYTLFDIEKESSGLYCCKSDIINNTLYCGENDLIFDDH